MFFEKTNAFGISTAAHAKLLKDLQDSYDKAAEILIQASHSDDFDAAEVAKKLFIYPDAPIPYSLYYLQQLAKKGYIMDADTVEQKVPKPYIVSSNGIRFIDDYIPKDKGDSKHKRRQNNRKRNN